MAHMHQWTVYLHKSMCLNALYSLSGREVVRGGTIYFHIYVYTALYDGVSTTETYIHRVHGAIIL